jgi:hypothetical protein
MTHPNLSTIDIDQTREEGAQAARHGLPFRANPYPHGSEHAKQWEHGFIGGMRPDEEVE